MTIEANVWNRANNAWREIMDSASVTWDISENGILRANVVPVAPVFDDIEITGGAIDGTPIGATTPSTGAFTTLVVGGIPILGNIPQVEITANRTLVISDAQKHMLHPDTDNNPRTCTIPANASVPFPIGTAVTFANMINVLSIACNDTLVFAPAGSTGTRALAANGICTALKIRTTVWNISGVGLS